MKEICFRNEVGHEEGLKGERGRGKGEGGSAMLEITQKNHNFTLF